MDRLADIVSTIAQQPDLDSIIAATNECLETPGNRPHRWLLEQLALFLRNPNHAALCSDEVLRRIAPVAKRMVTLGALSAEAFDSLRFSELMADASPEPGP